MYITAEQIYEQTNGGLDIILRYYPNAPTDGKKFRIREHDKTPSGKLQRKSGNIWVITDFGIEPKGKNAISLVMEMEKLDFAEACQWIAKEFQLTGENGGTAKLYESESRPASADEKEGQMTFARKKDFSETEIRTMFSDSLIQWLEKQNAQKQSPDKDPYKKAKEVLQRYGWSSLEQYTITKKGKTHTFFANDRFPMFIMEDGEFAKIYKPKEPEKQFRFMYYPAGNFPKDHVWGLKQLKDEYKRIQKIHDEFLEKDIDSDEKAPPSKLDYALIISGERDSMNAALMGYWPVWQNSETKGISRGLYKELSSMASQVVNVPDIDATGQAMGVKGALENIELQSAWLPMELKSFKDQRGHECKDLRDFLSVKDGKGMQRWKKKDFDRLIKTAKRCQFWQKIYTKEGEEWHIDSVNLLYYLWCSGFRKLKNDGMKDGYQYVQINGHMVTEVDQKYIRSYVRNYLEEHYQENKLMNKFLRSTVLNDGQLEYLEEVEIDFTAHGQDYQRMHFINQSWDITKDGIRVLHSNELSRLSAKVWAKSIIKHRVSVIEPMFETGLNDEGFHVAKPINHECVFLKYLVATSRMHWRKEEAGMLAAHLSPEQMSEYWNKSAYELDGPIVSQFLNREEREEQSRNLANKLFTLGYLLHNHKDPTRPWGVYAMDGKLSEEGQSHGRSGKSLFFKCVRLMLETKTISGRNTDITRNAYLFDGVTTFTRLILIDDCNEYLKYDHFFTPLTDSLSVNPKFVREFEIPFEHSPKFGFTSNYALKNPDPSLLGRLQFMVFSDFFHVQNNESDYLETRNPKDWLGKALFGNEFTERDWNLLYNLCAQAIQYYLNCDSQVKAPLGEVNLRQLKSIMGESFIDWATVYFNPETGNLNRRIARSEAYEACADHCKFKNFQTREFTKRLKAFVKYMNSTEGGYHYNPEEQCTASGGRIIARHEITGKTEEFIYVAGPKPRAIQQKSLADQAFEEKGGYI